MLKQPKILLDTLKLYDKDHIPEKIIAEIKPYIEREDFSVKKVEAASVACRAICMWVHAMYQYYLVNAEVEPKRVVLRGAEAELEVVTIALNEAKEKMRAVEERLASLQAKFDALVSESESLKVGVEQCKVKLTRAEKLISGLGGEKERWISTVERLNSTYENIEGDVLIAAGTIAYLGAFTQQYRASLIDEWRVALTKCAVRFSESSSVLKTLGDAVQIRAWNIAGLPSDAVSVENGIIMSKARRWPLLIDPQQQANKFIKKLGAQKFENGMDVVKLTDKNFVQTFENCIRFGKWILLEDVGEEVDPALEPILLQQIINIKGAPHIKIGDATIPYNDQFHLYMTTKLPNPHYAPELQVKVTLLNFTLTRDGLTDQMLGTVVAKESPELEVKKNALVVQNARMKKQLLDLEDQILRLLAEAKGDILDDEQLIDTLASSKVTSEEVNKRVAEAEVVEKEIDLARAGYTVVAERASILYFAISDLSSIDPMYQYSLQWFVALFVSAIAQTPASNELSKRLRSLNDEFTRLLYENICRSLFEKHKLLFSFLLTVRIQQANRLINDVDWSFLVQGGASTKLKMNPAPHWTPENVWQLILALSDLRSFTGFEESFASELNTFQTYMNSADPYTSPLPDKWESNLDSFQKLLVLRCLRPDKMMPAIAQYVAATLGKEYVESPPFSLSHSFKDSNNQTPLIFVLSRGADPASALFAFAKEQGFHDKIVSISLGQGQGSIAARHIVDAQKKGHWVLLQNAHLALSWLPALEKICNDSATMDVHQDYRLWLTSMPAPAFPVSILQNGIKMTNEPPKGLRANLQRSYAAFSDASVDECTKPREFKKLLYAMCFFHAAILERRRFGPLGWNIAYQFTENDLTVCVGQLKEFINMYDDIPYKVIHFLTYDVNYGGRVTDDIDRRTMCAVLDDFINPNVMSDEYAFTSSGKYKSIPAGSIADYQSHIATLDARPAPEVFGMHDNADISSAQAETASILSTIQGLLPRQAAVAGKSREEMIEERVNQLAMELPAPFDLDDIAVRYPTDYNESINTVLLQEAARYNKLTGVVRSSLANLSKALRGQMVMTESLEQMSQSLYTNVVPDVWSAVAYPSLMPLQNWYNDLKQRLSFLKDWIDCGIPSVFWMSGLFFPQAFLTGTLQNYARKHGFPIDEIQFTFIVTKYRKASEVLQRPSDGIYVSGLSLQGCGWDEQAHSLCDSAAKELFVSFPIIHLLPQRIANGPGSVMTSREGIYRCPVYKILTRAGTLSTTGHSTNFVFFIDLPTNVDSAKWIKAGAALFCALAY